MHAAIASYFWVKKEFPLQLKLIIVEKNMIVTASIRSLGTCEILVYTIQYTSTHNVENGQEFPDLWTFRELVDCPWSWTLNPHRCVTKINDSSHFEA